jgi:TFIIF-interacting CTD phosphatase-like protein
VNIDKLINRIRKYSQMTQGISLFVDMDETLVKYIKSGEIPQGIQGFRLHGDSVVLKRPGVEEFLTKLKQIGPVYLCTHAEEEYVNEVLDAVNLRKYFDKIYTREDIWSDNAVDMSHVGDAILIDNSLQHSSKSQHKLQWLGISEEESTMHYVQVPEFTGTPDNIFDAVYQHVIEKISIPMS